MKNIELLDGAMGSEFIRRGFNLPKYIWSADMNISNYEEVYKLHCEYVDSGCSYLTTNTFRTTPRAYMKTGLDYEKAFRTSKKSMSNAVNAAKMASDGKCKILGSIAPLEDCYMPEKLSLIPPKDRILRVTL